MDITIRRYVQPASSNHTNDRWPSDYQQTLADRHPLRSLTMSARLFVAAFNHLSRKYLGLIGSDLRGKLSGQHLKQLIVLMLVGLGSGLSALANATLPQCPMGQTFFNYAEGYCGAWHILESGTNANIYATAVIDNKSTSSKWSDSGNKRVTGFRAQNNIPVLVDLGSTYWDSGQTSDPGDCSGASYAQTANAWPTVTQGNFGYGCIKYTDSFNHSIYFKVKYDYQGWGTGYWEYTDSPIWGVKGVASPSAGGSVKCLPSLVDYGGTITCTATPAPGYEFSDPATLWSGCSSVNANGQCVVNNVKNQVTVTATFKTYPITAAADPTAGGSVECTPNPVKYANNASCTYNTNTGYTFSNWSGDCTGNASCNLVNVTSAKSVTAAFTINKYPFATAMAGSGSGSVAGSTTNGTYNYNSIITLNATPSSGSHFGGWSPSGCVNGFKLTGNTTCTATFTLDTHRFSTTTSGNGSGSLNGSTPNGIYNYGTTIALKATADPGSTLTGWSPSGCIDKSPLTEDTTCTANFDIAVAHQNGLPTRTSGVTADLTLTGCDTIESAGFVDGAGAYSFPFGLLGFKANGCGSSVTVTVKYSRAVPAGTQFYKCQEGTCRTYPATIAGNTVTYTVVDGGSGDADGVANNSITDPSGLGSPLPIPTLDLRALILLSALLALLAYATLHQRSRR